MPLDTAIFWMVIMLLLGVVIGMALAQKHIHGVFLFLIVALVILVGIFLVLGGHAVRLQ